MQTHSYKSLKKEKQSSELIDDFLVVEAPLEICINQKAFTMVMRTPGNDHELIRGLLFAEDIYKEAENFIIENIESNDNGFKKVNITIPEIYLRKGYLNKRSLLSVSSCGICGKQSLGDIQTQEPKLTTDVLINFDEIPKMFDIMRQHQDTFEITGGSHAAAVFNKTHHLISIKEDIGRHNAVDKCIGALLYKNTLNSASFLFVSGRVSYEIISKAFIAKIGVIVAVSACSSLAVDFAKEFGICLIGFSRNGKATVYANPNRIVNSENKSLC